jgi:serine/threonine protein kinase
MFCMKTVCYHIPLFLITILLITDIIHGDVKPQNILVAQVGESYVPKLTDFESSCLWGAEDDHLTVRRSIPWQAPEWHDRYFEVKQAKLLDVYSYGLVCFFTLFQSSFSTEP